MREVYLAIDIGASSGRHIAGEIVEGRLRLTEVYRFPNGMKPVDGHLCWDVDELFRQVLAGMKRCAELGMRPVSVGIDTWAVDYALLDGAGERIGEVIGYRDGRTAGVDERVYRVIPEAELYARTGIQKQIFNTIYQLMADGRLAAARQLLMVPDYLAHRLTGASVTEYTNATTTQLVSPATFDWDWPLIDRLGYPRRLFGQIVPPGTPLGGLLPEVRERVGFDCPVIAVATHDTASAVAAVPAQGEALYISSGTWSLMGTEQMAADCSEESRRCNLTNEGGCERRFRYLKNIMGLWMIQSVRHELNDAYSFARLCELAEETGIASLVDCNDSRFLAPDSMIAAVQGACAESGQAVPETPGELARVIYRSLAACYRDALAEIEARTGRRYDTIHIVGGGANAGYLNRLTAQFTGRRVLAGPEEATATGNLLVQMIARGDLKDLRAARELVARSFALREYGDGTEIGGSVGAAGRIAPPRLV